MKCRIYEMPILSSTLVCTMHVLYHTYLASQTICIFVHTKPLILQLMIELVILENPSSHPGYKMCTCTHSTVG